MASLARIAFAAATAASIMAAQSLDFETYRTKVEPIFLKKRPNHARCVVCHSAANNSFKLLPLDEGAAAYTEAESRQNFAVVSRLVNFKNVLESPLLKHPLAHDAGGDEFHSGGRQFLSRDDPDWKAMADWIRAAK
jgi:hypothetical protein